MLILMRHGQSMWNRDPKKPQLPWKYAGAVDVPLSETGINEAIKAGHALEQIPIDVVYCSMLIRAQTTTLIALAAHHDGKAPLIVRDTEEGEGKERGLRVHMKKMSEGSHQTVIPVYCSYQLDERSFGNLQGMYSWEQKKHYNQNDLEAFRKEWNVPFPGGESQAEVYDRTVRFFEKHIRHQLNKGKNVLICCHGFVVRALIAHILDLTPESYKANMVLDLQHDPRSLLHSENAIPRIFKYEKDEKNLRANGTKVFQDISKEFPILEELAPKKKAKL